MTTPTYAPETLTGPAATAAAALTDSLADNPLDPWEAAMLADHLMVTVLAALPTDHQNRTAAEVSGAMVAAAEDYTGTLAAPDPDRLAVAALMAAEGEA